MSRSRFGDVYVEVFEVMPDPAIDADVPFWVHLGMLPLLAFVVAIGVWSYRILVG